MKRYILIIAMIFIGMGLNAQNYKVIVNKSNTVSSLTSKDASNLFLKKTSKWDSGEKVMPVDLSSKSDIRAEFSKAVLGKSVGAIKSYWQQYVFAGKGTPPSEKSTDEEVIQYVSTHPGAIGYVSNGADVSAVKAISVN